jgi:hypothetical protein
MSSQSYNDYFAPSGPIVPGKEGRADSEDNPTPGESSRLIEFIGECIGLISSFELAFVVFTD